MLHPELRPLFAQFNELIAHARAEGLSYTPEATRAALDGLRQFYSDGPQLAKVEDGTLAGVPARLYHPQPEQALPVVLYLHGGGHMCGSVELYDPMCRKLAEAAQCAVVSVEYRRSPEAPYPLGLDDCDAALQALDNGWDGVALGSERMVAGDSAGGALCASLVQRDRQRGDGRIRRQMLIYPSLDYTQSLPSCHQFGRGYLLEAEKIAWYFDQYFQQQEDRVACSPLFDTFTATYPQTLVITAGLDPLQDEGMHYHRQLVRAGALSEHHHFADMPHAFMNLEQFIPERCEQLYTLLARFIQGDSPNQCAAINPVKSHCDATT
ncbi:alpha/beta hydrolase [Ferrimonas marina]|uniref:Acetyl esterase/lipase n=1 Tax=Ferrimonas marina TaxID=299255 RepID=A0A1M5QXL7_9GAMM|nr:alpha/beta hydrolase [Ferrimonas marina]SHH18500.1 Acetyl esterase/lipase [Ferrimonas marina]